MIVVYANLIHVQDATFFADTSRITCYSMPPLNEYDPTALALSHYFYSEKVPTKHTHIHHSCHIHNIYIPLVYISRLFAQPTIVVAVVFLCRRIPNKEGGEFQVLAAVFLSVLCKIISPFLLGRHFVGMFGHFSRDSRRSMCREWGNTRLSLESSTCNIREQYVHDDYHHDHMDAAATYS